MASREYSTRVTIDGDGSAAIAEFDRVGGAARELDSEIDQIDGRKIDLDTSGAVADVDRVDDAIDGAQRNADDGLEFGGAESGGSLDLMVGKLGKAAGPLGAAGIAAGLYAAVEASAQNAENAAVLAESLNLSLTDASRLENAFQDVNVDVGGVYGLMEQFVAKLGESPELADELGVAMGPDGVLDPVEALGAAIDNWDLLTPTERMELFGEEGVLAISRMRATGKSFEDVMNDIADTRVTSEEDLERLRQYREVTAEIKGLWEGIVVTIGNDVLDTLGALRDPVGYVKSEVREIGVQLGLIGDDQTDNIAKMEEFAAASGRARDQIDGAKSSADGLVSSVELIPNEIPVDVKWKQSGLPPGYNYPPLYGRSQNRVVAGAGASAMAAAVPRNSVAPATNITINVARTSDMRDVFRATQRWARINGRPATEFRQAGAT